jgi:hypothetical protein
MKATSLALGFGVLTASSLVASHARADFSAGVVGGYGLPRQADGDDVWRWGYGARAGYTFLLPVYIGVASTFHAGSADDEAGAPRQTVSYHGLEGGLDLTLASLGLRPYVSAGLADLTTTRDVKGGFLSPFVAIGVMPSLRVVDLPGLDLYLGLDARYVRLLRLVDNGDNSHPESALPVYVTALLRAF